MNNTTVFTPLESLFLFQSLAKYGFVHGAFQRISDDLNQHQLIREQPAYNAARLRPELLEQLARQLVRDEQHQDADAVENNTNGGAISPNSRKRKLPTPPLPSLKELQSQSDRLPALVDRLYARYRDDIVRQIREDEAKIDALQRDIAKIESEETRNLSTPQPPSKAAVALPVTNGNNVDTSKAAKLARPNGHLSQTPIPVPTPQAIQTIGKQGIAAASPVAQPVVDRRTAQPSASPVPPYVRPPSEVRQATPGARPSEFGRPQPGPSSGLQHPQAVQAYGSPSRSNTPQPAAADGLQRPDVVPTSQSPAPRPASQPPQSQTPGSGSLTWEPPYQPNSSQQTPIQSPHPYFNTAGTSRPLSHPSQPYSQPQSQPLAGHAQHPQHTQLQQQQQANIGRQSPQPLPQSSRSSIPGHVRAPQPVLVPPQHGQLPPSLPLSNQDPAVQQPQHHRAPPGSTLGSTSTAAPFPHHGHTPVRTSVPSSRAQTPVRNAPVPMTSAYRSGLATPGQLGPSHVPSAPSTPVDRQASTAPIHYLNGQDALSSEQSQQQLRRPTAQDSRPLSTTLPPFHPPSQPHTPIGSSLSTRVIRGHGTKWTATPTPATPRLEMTGYFDCASPAFEPLSPPPAPVVQLPRSSPQQSGRKDAKKNVQKVDTSVPKSVSRLSRSAQKATPLSHSEEMVEDSKIKNEEDTPKPFEDLSETTAEETTSSKLHRATSRSGLKRKRQPDSPAVNHGPREPPSHVLWTRSFNKVSSQALEQVTSHRHANMFANPIKARDAPGYPDVILRPQDLKGIRAAINQGQRAAQAAEKTLPDSDPTAMNVWLPISIDLIPPRGIINIAQLERELVHMFANSIMYNSDPNRGVGPSFTQSPEDGNADTVGYEVDENGIVKETRNMFMEVEKLMSDLRSEIERNAQPTTGPASTSRAVSVAAGEASTVEEDHHDEQPGDTDAPSAAKRRRVRG